MIRGINPYLDQTGRRFFIGLLSLICAILVASCIAPTGVGGENRAAIVIQHPSGRITSVCVRFEGEEINGEDLLKRSGIPYVADQANPMGSIICSIDGSGCNFPSEKCFCQCSGPGSCSYWSYFVMNESGDWIYAPLGARLRKLHNGDLDAWVWINGLGFGQDDGTSDMPDVNFEDICQE